MLPTTLDQVTAELLRKLCEEGCPESDTLDFKRDLPGGSDKDKHELLKDVSSLANTNGGDLVYGIDEHDGSAAELTPLQGESADAAKRRISQVLDAGVEPRIQGIKFHHVSAGEGYVLIIRVPSSFDGPHCVRTNQNRRFFMRNGTSTSDLTFDQLRAAFDRTATLAEQARRFITERLRLIISKQTPKPMSEGPLCVIHFVPVAGLSGRHKVDIHTLHKSDFRRFADHKSWDGCSRTLNLDGLVVHPGGNPTGGYNAYTHIFRTGAMEGLFLVGAKSTLFPGGPVGAIIYPYDMAKFISDSASKFIEHARVWGFAGPAVLSIAVLHVEGYELGREGMRGYGQTFADRPHLPLPEVWIEDIDNLDRSATIVPLLDTLWQAFGVTGCQYIDHTTGALIPKN